MPGMRAGPGWASAFHAGAQDQAYKAAGRATAVSVSYMTHGGTLRLDPVRLATPGRREAGAGWTIARAPAWVAPLRVQFMNNSGTGHEFILRKPA